MHIETRPTGFIEENCYIITNPSTREAVVIDPGADAPQLLATLREQGTTVVAYLLTHGHVDHLSALAAMCAEQPAPIYVHPLDGVWCFTELNHIPGYYDAPAIPKCPRVSVSERTPIELAGATWIPIETPGHTPGGVCWQLACERALFTGDTLFRGTAGRTDFPGGSAPTLTKSLKKLAALEGDWTIYSGHGDPTTLAHERKNNYFMIS